MVGWDDHVNALLRSGKVKHAVRLGTKKGVAAAGTDNEC
jgi:hypothetical protein